MNQEKLGFVDSLRGIAVLAVILSHTPLPPGYSRLNFIGAYGVQLFFVVSAFTLFLSTSARAGSENHPVRNFFLRRLFRIAPAFYAAAAFYLWKDGTAATAAAPFGIDLWHVVSTLLFLHGWHPESINLVVPGGWSIAVEMTFYLFVPMAFATVRSAERAALVAFVLMVAGVAAGRLVGPWVQAAYPPSQSALAAYFVQLWFPSQACVFPLGFLLYHLHRDGPPASRAAAACMMFAVAYLCAAFSSGGYALLPPHFLYGLAFVILGHALSRQPFRLIVNPLSRHIGKVSFSVYLLHFWAISLVKDQLGPVFEGRHPLLWSAVFYIATATLAVLAATVAHRLIEEPGQALGRRLIRHLEARSRAAATRHT